MAKSLKEKKIEMKNDWESCLELKLEDKLTEKGLKKFWDENTSLEEAEAMLTHAAIDDFVGHLFGSLAEAIIIGVGGCQDEEEDNEQAEQFQVYRSHDNFFYEDTFDSVDAAKDFIKKQAMNSTYKVDDFKVVKVYD